MKNSQLMIACLVLISMCLAPVVRAGEYSANGVFSSTYVDQEWILDSSKPFIEPSVAAPLIETYIHDINPNRDANAPNDISTKDLAKRIAGVSYCFHIDPFVFTSLIRQESITYNQRADSPTGARGLTQFTTIAVEEVDDQLGIRGNHYARSTAINYFNGVIADDCLEKNGEFKSTGSNYKPLWELDPASSSIKGSSAQAFKMAKMLVSYPEYALIYGAILLKVNFSLVESGYKTGCYTYKDGHPETLADKFKEVVMMYNGDGCTTQKAYQTDILGKFYPDIINADTK